MLCDDRNNLNKKLRVQIYARLSGYGQSGPFRDAAGHDINYLALSGGLGVAGHASETPSFAANLLGDFGGGGLMCAMGIALALVERNRSGRGQVIDASIFDGSAYVAAFAVHSRDQLFGEARGHNMLDSGAHFYDTYECADGGFMAVGAIEPQFYSCFVDTLGVQLDADQMDADQWPAMKAIVAARFRSQPRAYWEKLFRNKEACVTPVLSLDELTNHEHARERGTYLVSFKIARFSVEPLLIVMIF